MTLTRRLVLAHLSEKRRQQLAKLADERARHKPSKATVKAAVRETCKILQFETKEAP